MAYTITAGTASTQAVGTDPTPAYPASAGMGAGKLAVLQLCCTGDSGGTISPPAGWTQIGSDLVSGTTFARLFQRTLDGSETAGGTIICDQTGTSGRRGAFITTIDAPGTGWNFENVDGEVAGSSTTINDNDVTTGGSGRLALNYITYSQQQTLGQENFAGEAGGAWVASAYYAGATPSFSVQSCELASAGTISGGSDTSITAAKVFNWGFSIWRNASSQPDLVVDDFTWTPGLAVGEATTFTANIHNVGTVPSPTATHRVRWEVSGAAIAFSTSWGVALTQVSGSAVVASDGTWVPTVGVSTAIVAIIDDLNLIAESNEGNNTLSKTTGIISRPNLQIADILWTPASPVVGDSVQFAGLIKNFGPGASPVTAHVINFEVGGAAVATATGQTASIAVSAAVTASADGFWTPGASGTFTIAATVDPESNIAESNETDNTRSESITIGVGSGNVTSFNGRGGAVVPIQQDYDSFFLTQSEADDLYTTLAEVTAAVYDKVASDAKYLTQALADPLYLTQTEADAQGMPATDAAEYNGGGTPSSPATWGTGNITLRVPSTAKDFIQARFNSGTTASTVNLPAGYSLVGSNSIAISSSALFVKKAGVNAFIRWS